MVVVTHGISGDRVTVRAESGHRGGASAASTRVRSLRREVVLDVGALSRDALVVLHVKKENRLNTTQQIKTWKALKITNGDR